MEAELNKSAIPLRRVKRVQFGILGPDEIVSWDLASKLPQLMSHMCIVGMRKEISMMSF